MWKWILVIVGVLVALVVGLGVWAKSSGALDSLLATMNPESKPLKVVLSKVDTGDVVRIISAPGLVARGPRRCGRGTRRGTRRRPGPRRP